MMNEKPPKKRVVIIGGGPAGLTAAYQLVKFGHTPTVLEKTDKAGGIARTDTYKGFYFDMGGHRFFTKAKEVNDLWREVLGPDFLRRPRLSRIYYQRKFFYYPLKPFDALLKLGFWRSALILTSYVKWHFFPHRREDTFEQWVTNRFGERLFLTFFKTYTEKVWGIPCSRLKAEWAAQRIKDLSLKTALLSMFLKPKTMIKTLIDEFHYPRLGPGMMWNAFKDAIEQRGGAVTFNSEVVRIRRSDARIDSVVVARHGRGEEELEGTDFISSMPVTELIKRLDPPPPGAVLDAARRLTHRDFLTVCLIVNRPDLFPDNWIYIHDPSVKVGRIQNFKNWSADMVPDPAKTSLGLEYFCTEGDEVWNMPDQELIELGKREVDRIGLARYQDIEDGCVVRVEKAYPVYDSDYGDHLALIRQFLAGFENLQTIGRNGLHRYNNQDHSMMTGLLAVRNLLFGEKNDLWAVNTDREYHEEVLDESERDAVGKAVEAATAQVFAKLDRAALGVSLGSATGAAVLIATLWLVLKGGETVGPNLQLLGQYFPGYSVSPPGSVLGLAYGFAAGFAFGWTFAFFRNIAVFLTRAVFEHRAERRLLRRLLDYV